MSNAMAKVMEPEYDFSKGEPGKFYTTDIVLHLPVGQDSDSVLNDTDDWDETEWLRAAANNSTFDFLKDAAEDIYSPTDGVPFRDEE